MSKWKKEVKQRATLAFDNCMVSYAIENRETIIPAFEYWLAEHEDLIDEYNERKCIYYLASKNDFWEEITQLLFLGIWDDEACEIILDSPNDIASSYIQNAKNRYCFGVAKKIWGEMSNNNKDDVRFAKLLKKRTKTDIEYRKLYAEISRLFTTKKFLDVLVFLEKNKEMAIILSGLYPVGAELLC